MEWKTTISEKMNNPNFNVVEFDHFRIQAGSNAVFINDGISQSERLMKLNKIAIQQMQVLEETTARTLLK